MTQAAFEGANYLVQPYLIDRGVEVGTLFSFLQLPIFGAGLLGALFAARIQTRFGATAGPRHRPTIWTRLVRGSRGDAGLRGIRGLGDHRRACIGANRPIRHRIPQPSR